MATMQVKVKCKACEKMIERVPSAEVVKVEGGIATVKFDGNPETQKAIKRAVA